MEVYLRWMIFARNLQWTEKHMVNVVKKEIILLEAGCEFLSNIII